MSQRVDDLIQLMRLSGTDKVRAHLEKLEAMAARSGYYDVFLNDLNRMFQQCKRDSITEAWPPQPTCTTSAQAPLSSTE